MFDRKFVIGKDGEQNENKAQLLTIIMLVILIILNIIVFTTNVQSDKMSIETKQNQYYNKE